VNARSNVSSPCVEYTHLTGPLVGLFAIFTVAVIPPGKGCHETESWAGGGGGSGSQEHRRESRRWDSCAQPSLGRTSRRHGQAERRRSERYSSRWSPLRPPRKFSVAYSRIRDSQHRGLRHSVVRYSTTSVDELTSTVRTPGRAEMSVPCRTLAPWGVGVNRVVAAGSLPHFFW
jgi:hypothetical protein